ncbi:MAG: hypothetical protein JWO06_812 [Bacteroidota bacterium]|nr:hypothetical protein [Bacteroidota bacterium]
MGQRKVSIKKSVAESIAQISWFIESKGMVLTAEKFSNSVYDYFGEMADDRRQFATCRNIQRASLGYKCISFNKKYTIVFIETDKAITICEFLPSKLVK